MVGTPSSGWAFDFKLPPLGGQAQVVAARVSGGRRLSKRRRSKRPRKSSRRPRRRSMKRGGNLEGRDLGCTTPVWDKSCV
jgi:hypothetical protein